MDRLSKVEGYMLIAEAVSSRSTCRRRQYGAVLVNNDEIISTGYNGSPRGFTNCIDTGTCQRILLNCAPGTGYEKCRAVHAEENAIISAERARMLGGTLYLAGFDVVESQNNDAPYRIPTTMKSPCIMCARHMVNAGIKSVVMYDSEKREYVEMNVHDLYSAYEVKLNG